MNNLMINKNFKLIHVRHCCLVIFTSILIVQSVEVWEYIRHKSKFLALPISLEKSLIDPQRRQSESFSSAMALALNVLVQNDVSEQLYESNANHDHVTSGSVFKPLLSWLIPSANAALPPPPDGPILIITSGNQGTNASPDFGGYYSEILRTEGFNEFSVTNIALVTPQTLALYDVVILAKMSLSTAQVDMLSTWVENGGNLIAMRPDKKLAPLLGLTDANTTLNNGYLFVSRATTSGVGIVGQTMQFHGVADRYTLKTGTTNIAKLYANAATATTNSAITLRNNIGASGAGKAAAFTYDLAASIVYTRQGNPAWADQERDGFIPIRSDDKFFGQAAGDPQVDWINLNKIAIPQADEQQRLLGNLILEMNRRKKPLPRFWYFPLGLKAAVIMTGDDHANNGTQGRFDYFLTQSPTGCSVRNWECVRGTSYLYPSTPLSAVSASSYNSQGFEVGLHVNTNCADFTAAPLEAFYVDQIGTWTAKYNSIPAPVTQRHHCIAWSGWAIAAKVQLNHGIRFDTSYYFWPPSWVLNRPGFFSGSGMPMRFSDLDGSLIDVYNATTQMTDESGQGYPFTINKLLDNALGIQGYYGAFTVNAHTDLPITTEATAVVASAKARGVPIVTSRQMLDWFDHRNSSSFAAINWSGKTLKFTVIPGVGSEKVPANGLQVLLPIQSRAGLLTKLTRNNAPTSFSSPFIKGLGYAALPGIAGNYVATYEADNVPPTVISTSPSAGAIEVSIFSKVEATFSEAVNPVTVNANTFELRDVNNVLVVATVSYNTNTRTATLTPKTPLAATTTYTVTIKGGATDPRIKDLVGKALAANVTRTFTTGQLPCSSSACSAWLSSTIPGTPVVNDPNAVELGVKFRSDINGLITGVRFYQINAGTYQGTLWSLSGQKLATGSITSTASGWQQVNFSTPVAITAGTVYIASYYAPTGNYAANNNPEFSSGGVDNPPIHLLQDGDSGLNGVYQYGASTAFPTNSFQSNNYWVDVSFRTTPPLPLR